MYKYVHGCRGIKLRLIILHLMFLVKILPFFGSILKFTFFREKLLTLFMISIVLESKFSWLYFHIGFSFLVIFALFQVYFVVDLQEVILGSFNEIPDELIQLYESSQSLVISLKNPAYILAKKQCFPWYFFYFNGKLHSKPFLSIGKS